MLNKLWQWLTHKHEWIVERRGSMGYGDGENWEPLTVEGCKCGARRARKHTPYGPQEVSVAWCDEIRAMQERKANDGKAP